MFLCFMFFFFPELSFHLTCHQDLNWCLLICWWGFSLKFNLTSGVFHFQSLFSTFMPSIVFSIAFQLFVFSQSPSFIYIFFKVLGHIRNYYFEVHDLCSSYITFLGPCPIGSLGSEESTLSWLFMCVCLCQDLRVWSYGIWIRWGGAVCVNVLSLLDGCSVLCCSSPLWVLTRFLNHNQVW